MDFKEKFLIELNNRNMNLTEDKIEKFHIYMKLLLEWNEKINLTAITEEDEILTKHFIDSLTISKYIKDTDRIIDIGTGAGFPGIPLKIERENNEIVLMDSLNKRIKYLEDVIDKLELKHITAVHGRAEEFGIKEEYREKFDIATARAVANLPVLLEYCLPFVKVGGYFLCMKGPDVEEEVNMAKKALEVLGGKIEKIEIPFDDIRHSIIVIKKVASTPKKYPRNAGKIKKEAIG